MRPFNNFKVHGFPKTQTTKYDSHNSIFTTIIFQNDAFLNISRTILTYREHLTNGKDTSKLSYANRFTNEGAKKIVEQYITDFYPTMQNRLRKMLFDVTDLTQVHCQMYVRAVSDPMLKAFYVKLYDHYNRSNDSEKLAIRTYFNAFQKNTLTSMLVNGTVMNVNSCIGRHAKILQFFKDATFLPKVIVFKDSMEKMESLLETARLEGNVFRYITIIL